MWKGVVMAQRLSGIALALLLAIPFFVASCGDDDEEGSTIPSNGDPTAPPGIADIELPAGIDFQSDDPVARQAFMQTQFSLIPLVLTIGHPLIVALPNATWTQGDGGCWSWTFSPAEADCSFLYVPCKTNDGFDWTMTIDGDYFGEDFDNWVAVRGTTSDDGATGTLQWHQDHTTTVASVWTWTTDAEWVSGTLNVYNAEATPENLSAILEWTRLTDGYVDATHTSLTGKRRLELHISADGTAGWVKTYDLDENTQTYVIEKWISWENGHGFWNIYDEGNLTQERTW
jgi:hypothetical protein